MFTVRSDSCGKVEINGLKPAKISNENLEGSILFLHRTDESMPEIENPFAPHFAVKKRRWELRLQIKFLKPIEEGQVPLFGIEVDEIPSSYFLRVVLAICKSINRAKGDTFHYSLGKEGQSAYIIFPLWVMDTIIPTVEGEELPDLAKVGELPLTSHSERRKMKFENYPNATWTFVYFNAYIDLIMWELCNLPAYKHAPISKILGDSDLRVILCSPEAVDESNTGASIESLVDIILKRPREGEGDDESRRESQVGGQTDWESVREECSSLDDDIASQSDWQSVSDYSDTKLMLSDYDQLCGTYYSPGSYSYVSTLVINSSGNFWHSLYVRTGPSKPKNRRSCGVAFATPWKAMAKDQEEWETLEVLGKWEPAENNEGVVLTCEQWRGASKLGLPPRLREKGGELDKQMGKLAITMTGSTNKGIRYLHRVAKSTDDESPEEFGTLALLGFSFRYTDQSPQ